MSQTQFHKLDDSLPRRGFLKIAIGFFNGLIALLLAVPGLGYLLTPVFRKGRSTWVEIGAVKNFDASTPQKAVFTYTSESGYTLKEKSRFVWVTTNDLGEVTVLSAVCSHTGCNVAWQSDEEKFVCPCHEGRYDIDGQVLSGPPPKQLTKLPTKIENGQIFIQMIT
ncbi:MAG: ubiquinol-cytochrome c reductase iron-sulfur subunit [bacterium]